jgi:hypothetical protein
MTLERARIRAVQAARSAASVKWHKAAMKWRRMPPAPDIPVASEPRNAQTPFAPAPLATTNVSSLAHAAELTKAPTGVEPVYQVLQTCA